MRRVLALLVVLGSGCGERHSRPTTPPGELRPAPPPPAGSAAVFGPLRIEAIDVARSEIGWERDLVRGSRVVTYDVVLAQERGACPSAGAPRSASDAVVGCRGVADLPPACTHETVRARVEVTVRWALDVQQRCAGDAVGYPLGDGADARSALATLGAACFRNRNKFRPESTWTSLYALTELRVDERVASVTASSPIPRLLLALLGPAATPVFCRDDGAYLDGTPGVDASLTAGAPELSTVAAQLAARATIAGESSPIGVTAGSWRSEQSMWDACNAPAAHDLLVAQQRCQLLRQLDRFVRDVEDVARPETPKGAPSPTPSTSSSSSSSTSPSAAPSGSSKGAP